MLHHHTCSCFNCKNGYTKESDKAKPLPRRKRKVRKIKPFSNKNIFTKQERKEYGENMRFLRGI